MTAKEQLQSQAKNSIGLKIGGHSEYRLGATRFGGLPDVPADFEWPTFRYKDRDHVLRERPLSFLAQFNCAELSQYDTERLLPDHGLLSFFYEMESLCGGFEPKDKGCGRVFWFEDISSLSLADYPENVDVDFPFPMLDIGLSSRRSYPSWEDLDDMFPGESDYRDYDKAYEELSEETLCSRSQLLGWPDVIQNSMFAECDLVAQGYTLWNNRKNIPKDVLQRATDSSRERWTLLLQLDTVKFEDFELMFVDCGHLYFYITKEDLAARRFDRVWQMLQFY